MLSIEIISDWHKKPISNGISYLVPFIMDIAEIPAELEFIEIDFRYYVFAIA